MNEKQDTHPSELLSAYIEEELTPEDRERVEQYVANDAEGRRRLDEMLSVSTVLRKRRDEAFCPPLWMLNRYVRRSVDPDGVVAEHLENCETCREQAAELRTQAESAGVPPRIHEAYQALQKDPQPASARPIPLSPRQASEANEDPSYRVGYFIGKWGLLMAAVLAFVIFYPFGGKSYRRVEFSGVSWGQIKSGARMFNLMGASKSVMTKPKLAVLVTSDGFDTPPGQKMVDAWYKALEPDTKILESYRMVQPAEVQNALKGKDLRFSDPQALAQVVGNAVHAEQVVLVTIVRADSDTYRINAARFATETGTAETTAASQASSREQVLKKLAEVMDTMTTNKPPKTSGGS
jgi:hypothetical protein